MDKGSETGAAAYSRDGQTLTVERYFTGTQTVREAVKQYLLEQRPKRTNRAAAVRAEDGK